MTMTEMDDNVGDDEPNLHPNAADKGPNPNPNTVADGKEQVGRLLAALERLANNTASGNQLATSKAKLWDPDQFDGSDPKKLQGFLLQCKLNFQAKPELFPDDAAKLIMCCLFKRNGSRLLQAIPDQ
jgi:hypothetical protein